jgi:DNA excision repair protein ERCC-4
MRLQDAYPRAVLLIEGEPQGMPEAAWRGAVCKLVEDGVTVLRSDGMADSAEWLLRLARRARREPGGAVRAKGQRRSPPTLPAQAAAMLACAPGISQGTALRLLAHFGSVQAIAAADEAALREVEGVGPVRAGALLAVLRWSPREG